MILYHYTNRIQLPKILAAGELLMTLNPHWPLPTQTPPVLWLTDQDGSQRGGDTLAHGLNLASPLMGMIVDRIEVRFTVEVPDDEVLTWEQYCDLYEIPKSYRRRFEKWPLNASWWMPFQRSITSDEWVEVGVGRDAWTPMFTSDVDGSVEGGSTVESHD